MAAPEQFVDFDVFFLSASEHNEDVDSPSQISPTVWILQWKTSQSQLFRRLRAPSLRPSTSLRSIDWNFKASFEVGGSLIHEISNKILLQGQQTCNPK